LFKNSIFRKLVVVCCGVGQGTDDGFLTGAEPSLSSARVTFPAYVNVVSWNSVFLIFQAEKDYDPFAERRRPTVAEKEDEYRQKRRMMIISPERVDPFAEGLSTSPQLAFYLCCFSL